MPGSFHLEHQVEGCLVLDGALLMRQPKTLPNQAHVEAGSLSHFGRCGRRGQERLLFSPRALDKESNQENQGDNWRSGRDSNPRPPA